MEYLGLALFALTFMLGTWWLGRFVTGMQHNNESEHGGGFSGYPTNTPYF